jgi:hypothetical protein
MPKDCLGKRAGPLAARRAKFRNKLADSFVPQTSTEKVMPKATWKRPGSPIGKKGPRKANPAYKRRSRQPWSDKEVKQLRSLAKANTPTGVISLKMQRPPASIASKAQREGISLTPINRSPYNRRKKTARRR